MRAPRHPSGPIATLTRLAVVTAACAALLTACDDDDAEPRYIDAATGADATPGDADPLADRGPDPADGGPPTAPDAAVERTARPATCAATAPPAGTPIGPDGGSITLGAGAGALVDAALVIAPEALRETIRVTLDCADAPIVPSTHVALGPPLRVGAERPQRFGYGHWARVTMVFDATGTPDGLEARHLRLFWRPDDDDHVYEPPMVNPEIDLVAGTVSVDTPGLGTFQLGHIAGVGELVPRRYAYRAIAGISMGAGAAAYLGTKHSREFDFIAPLGGAVDWPYMLYYITQRLTGGFCAHDEGGGLGAWCGLPPTEQQFEHEGSYINWHYSGSGGRFDRTEYGKLFSDMSFAYGNPLGYNPHSPYLPAGVPYTEQLRPVAERCAAECRGSNCPPPATFTIESGYYDDEYNPDGTLPVILFCDGEDGLPYGKFDQRVAHDKPAEIVLAVDLDGNGRRDLYEPVIRNVSEPYDDVGCDGLPSTEEPGYDPIWRPDPAGDDYDWYKNPLGTEGNWMYDGFGACQGDGAEPYRDVGLDGVPDTPQADAGGYDHGEGNLRFDYNPHIETYLERTGGLIFQQLPADERARLRVWTDGGIRDIFNFATAGNHWMGRLQAGGQNVRIYDDFHRVLPIAPGGAYLPSPAIDDPFRELGQSIFIRYGNPYATAEEVLETNDGEHVGTTNEALNRFISMYDWVHNRWEHLHFDPILGGSGARTETRFFHSERFGRTYRYAISVPPGYDDPARAHETYPVLLLLHGYGQAPEDLPATGALIGGQQRTGQWARTLIVSPDGSCGRTQTFQCNDGVDNDRDGTVDHAGDAQRRIACDADDDCARGYTCRPQSWPRVGKGPRYCCPEGFTDCGPPDLRCGREERGRTEGAPRQPMCSDGVDNDLDGLTDLEDEGCMGLARHDDEADCREGSFYTRHVARKDGRPGGADWEGALLDMLDHIDRNYRTRAPETVLVPR